MRKRLTLKGYKQRPNLDNKRHELPKRKDTY